MALDALTRWFRLGARPPLPPGQAYALWADTYPPWPHNPLMEAEQSIVAPIIAATQPARALDVGTGTGRYLPLLASAGARTVVGVDLSLPMLGRRSDETPRACGDARRLPFPGGTFDLVCSSLMAGDIEDLGAWVSEGARVLTPGGHLVYSDFHPSWASERWRRTFRTADGHAYELSYYPHAIEEHLTHLRRASLVVRAIREPRVDSRQAPVVVVFHAIKPGAPSAIRPHRSEAEHAASAEGRPV